MSEPTNRDLARYALGHANRELADDIERRAAADPELAAKLAVLRRATGADDVRGEPVAPPAALRPASARRRVARWAASLAAASWLGGLAWAGIQYFGPKPLLSESFDRDWGNPLLWETTRRTVTVEGGHARLFDRGYLTTRAEFPDPIEITLKWRWNDLGGDFLYRDELAVALRTRGRPGDEGPYEARDGVVVKFNATGGLVSVNRGGEVVLLAATAKGGIPMPAGQWLDVRVTDDGETISAYIARPGAAASPDVPALRVRVAEPAAGHRVAFYNRERLAAVSHESWIDDIVIRRLEAPPPEKP